MLRSSSSVLLKQTNSPYSGPRPECRVKTACFINQKESALIKRCFPIKLAPGLI